MAQQEQRDEDSQGVQMWKMQIDCSEGHPERTYFLFCGNVGRSRWRRRRHWFPRFGNFRDNGLSLISNRACTINIVSHRVDHTCNDEFFNENIEVEFTRLPVEYSWP